VPDFIGDDEKLLGALKTALSTMQGVPPGFIEAGKSAYAWRNIDAELAQLTYDSAHDRGALAGVRSEPASIRALTFTSARLTIELEVVDDCLYGQVIPTGPGAVEVQTHAGTEATSQVDELGSFRIQPIPASTFRLSCRTAGGSAVQTCWITF
jgi:hypothetical protein